MGPPRDPSKKEAALDAFRDLRHEDGITTAWVNLTLLTTTVGQVRSTSCS